MLNSELEDMLDDSKEQKFNEWGNQEVSFFENLSDEEKRELRSSYERSEESKEIWNKTMTAAMNQSGTGIDYSNDIDKRAAQWEQSKNNLNNTINKLSERHSKSK